MANNFTDQVYKKASDVFQNHTYAAAWETFLKDTVHARDLLAAAGPNVTHADGLDKLRTKLADDVKGSVAKILMGRASPTLDSVFRRRRRTAG